MEEIILRFEQWCKDHNWITKRNDKASTFPDGITQRYPMATRSDYCKFIAFFQECYACDEQSWFLCEHEYRKDASGTEFGWNVMELMGLEATVDDDEEQKRIHSWWDAHIPILLSVRDGYSHFSISLQESTFGQIVEGYEPIFEDVVHAADSLNEFLSKIMSKKIVF